MSKKRNIHFIAASTLLFIMALGTYTYIQYMGFFMQKERVELRKPLDTMPSRIGPYEVIIRRDRLPSSEEAVLGTKHYINFVVHDTRRPLPGESNGEPDLLALFRFHVVYYTGTADTVPHVPENCFVGAGAQANDSGSTELTIDHESYIRTSDGQIQAPTADGRFVTLPDRLYDNPTIPAKLFTYQNHPDDPPSYVTYFFVTNNQIVGSAEGVRSYFWTNLRDRYAYYAKIEINPATPGNVDREEAIAAISEMLSYLFPEVMACLPDWQVVTAAEPVAKP